MADFNPNAVDTTDEDLLECQKKLGYEFNDLQLLRSALTHASGARTRLKSNERLEFLGDAILGMVACEQLYVQFPDALEGELTRIKSVVVSRETCASISQELGIQPFLVLGKGMTNNSSLPNSLLADVFESIVAALYLDGGFAAAQRFILEHVGPRMNPVAAGDAGENFKSELQHYAQREHGLTPTYVLIESEGPDHDKMFHVAARVGQMTYEGAWGKSKKQAEQQAAKNALEVINA